MLIRRSRGWELRESAATPEAVFRQRRALLKAVGLGSILVPGLVTAIAAQATEGDPSAGLYPLKRNPRYTLDRPLTDAKYSENYNNFYEYGSEKSVADDAQELKIRPWTIKIDGLVDKEMTVGIDDLLKKMPLEERLYRHRCVEAWSMAVPWSGFAMAAFVDFAKPLVDLFGEFVGICMGLLETFLFDPQCFSRGNLRLAHRDRLAGDMAQPVGVAIRKVDPDFDPLPAF